MRRSVQERLNRWETTIIHLGIFLVFLATFADYVFGKIWPIIGPLFGR